MSRREGASPFLVIGVLLLVVGGIGVVYAQVQLTNANADGGDDGSAVDVGNGDDSGGDGGNSSGTNYRTLRLGSLVMGVVGAVMALAGGLAE